MNQYKFFELDLNTNYANKVLSYYLWGMDDPPFKDQFNTCPKVWRLIRQAVL